MVYEVALKPYADAGINVRYVSNIDPNDMAEKVKGLDPETHARRSLSPRPSPRSRP